jgi:hypothetical protein
MQPSEALGIAAQVAVTLAGFAGVVVVFRPESTHRWSALDRFRLHLLLTNSIYPLAFSVFGMLLLTINPPPESIWRWCSGVALLVQIPGALVSYKPVRSMKPAEFKGVNKVLFYPLFVAGVLTMLLQFYNVAVLNLFWPFFASITVHLVAAMLQFMRFVLPPLKSDG